jgi:cation transport ATPase
MSTPDDLNATLARLGNVLAREVEAWEQKTRVDRARVMEHVSKKIERALMSSTERRELRQRERAAAKAQRRARQLEQASVPGGVFLMAIAAVLVVFAFLSPEMWWLVFVRWAWGAAACATWRWRPSAHAPRQRSPRRPKTRPCRPPARTKSTPCATSCWPT